jgi:hypothetical protein
VSLNELLQSLSNGMVKGGVGGFLKTAKTATGIQPGGQRETRIGIAEVLKCTFLNPLNKSLGLCCDSHGTRLELVKAKYSILVPSFAGFGLQM